MDNKLKILDLPLKKQYYNLIESEIKKEEYREIKPYWMKRLFDTINIDFTHYEKIDNECADFYCNKDNIKYLKKDYNGGGIKKKPYTYVRFRYGYTKRTMLFELIGISIGKGKIEWGAPEDKEVFILKLGRKVNSIIDMTQYLKK